MKGKLRRVKSVTVQPRKKVRARARGGGSMNSVRIKLMLELCYITNSEILTYNELP